MMSEADKIRKLRDDHGISMFEAKRMRLRQRISEHLAKSEKAFWTRTKNKHLTEAIKLIAGQL